MRSGAKKRTAAVTKQIKELEQDVQLVRNAIQNEKAAALNARNRMIQLCQDKMVFVMFDNFDKYGRPLATVYPLQDTGSTNPDRSYMLADGAKSLNDIMMDEGFGVPYDGGTKKPFIWTNCALSS